MNFKLIIALIPEERTDAVMQAARDAGATGSTVINHARGEGLEKQKTFMGLALETQRDMLMFLVEKHLCREILETVATVGGFGEKGNGIAFQIDVEDAVGVAHQVKKLTPLVEDKL